MPIHDHTSYRDAIRAWLAGPPKRTQILLAGRVRTSRANVAMILKGQRDVSPAMSRAWGHALDLASESELQYFDDLVLQEQANTLGQRRKARVRARVERDFARAERPPEDLADLLGRWYVPAIFELARVPGFQAHPDWIRHRLWPDVEVEEIAAALARLVEAGLLRARGSGEPPVATEKLVQGDRAAAARQFHAAQLEHAREAMETLPGNLRHVASVTVAIRRDDLPRLIEALHRFQLEVVEPFRAADPDLVVQLGAHLFPRSRP